MMWTSSILGNLTSLSKGRYRIDSQLGSGGMGVVYRAYDTILNRTVAIKVLPHQVMDEEAEERFLREARSIARLSHPNIVTIYDFEQDKSLYCLILEYVEGG